MTRTANRIALCVGWLVIAAVAYQIGEIAACAIGNRR